MENDGKPIGKWKGVVLERVKILILERAFTTQFGTRPNHHHHHHHYHHHHQLTIIVLDLLPYPLRALLLLPSAILP